ncbi:MAG: hypothetical protein K2J78_07585 [Muribaculaceae bacterium]|nr:hypothetical protein [Muribaculaceae bacterium]MDE6769567.1 hypothetical protein [Muribaculaceae bacterium]
MKKIIPIFLTFLLLIMSACSNEEPIVLPTESVQNTEYLDLENIDLFLTRVDSLNDAYPTNPTRGFWSSFGKSLADQGGRAAGRVVGRWLGAAIGTAAANPALACMGYIGGQHVGGIIGYAAASAVAEILLSSAGYPGVSPNTLQLKVDYNIKPSKYTIYNAASNNASDLRCDSIGYYHNYVMVKINQNKGKYITRGEVNIDILYNDIIRYFKEVGVYSEPLANNNLVKNEMKKMAKQFAQLTLVNTQQSGTAEHLVNSQCDYLRSKCKVTADELKLYKDFTLRIANKSSVLSESELHRYANDLNLIIDDPRLSNEVKRDLAVSAMTTINSSLCWQQ